MQALICGEPVHAARIRRDVVAGVCRRLVGQEGPGVVVARRARRGDGVPPDGRAFQPRLPERVLLIKGVGLAERDGLGRRRAVRLSGVVLEVEQDDESRLRSKRVGRGEFFRSSWDGLRSSPSAATAASPSRGRRRTLLGRRRKLQGRRGKLDDRAREGARSSRSTGPTRETSAPVWRSIVRLRRTPRARTRLPVRSHVHVPGDSWRTAARCAPTRCSGDASAVRRQSSPRREPRGCPRRHSPPVRPAHRCAATRSPARRAAESPRRQTSDHRSAALRRARVRSGVGLPSSHPNYGSLVK